MIYENQGRYKNYFKINSSEGFYYLVVNSKFILLLEDYLSPKYKEFIQVYANDYEKQMYADAIILISDEELISRAYSWGELTKSLENTKLHGLIKTYYEEYIHAIISGTDNSLAFDWSSKKFSKKRYNLMKKVVNEHPNSVISKHFEDICKLLENSAFTESNDIVNYSLNLK